jgi:hypothetical protein
MELILNKIINKPMYLFKSIYGYLFDIQIGNPLLNITKEKNIEKIFNKKNRSFIYYNQEYFRTKILGEFTLNINAPWDILYNGNIIIDVDQYEHSETENIFNLYLNGHTILNIIDNEKDVELRISNKFIIKYYKNVEKGYYFNIRDNKTNKYFSIMNNDENK